MADAASKFDYCPWLFWRMASAQEQQSQIEFHNDLIKSGLVKLGNHCFISPHAGFVPTKVSLGDYSYIAAFAYVTDFLQAGSHCTINPFSVVRGKVLMGNGVRVASHASILAFNHTTTDPNQPIWQQGITSKSIIIGDDVLIGANAVILDGVTIGNHCIISAGAVVTRDVPDYATVSGVAARIVRDRRDHPGVVVPPAAPTISGEKLGESLREFSDRASLQWRNVLARCERSDGDRKFYVNAVTAQLNDFRPTCDAIEIAAMFGEVTPVRSKADWVALLQSTQDAKTGLPMDPLQAAKTGGAIDHTQAYLILSVGYALECLSSRFTRPLQAIHDITAEEMTDTLPNLPWKNGAWTAGAWVDSFATAMWFNREYFGLLGPIEPLFEWLRRNVDRTAGVWGEMRSSDGWLQPVNGFYRIERGTYAAFDRPLPAAEPAIDTMLGHIKSNENFESKNVNACNVLDVVHPLWILMRQSDHREDEIKSFLKRQLEIIPTRWINDEGFAFEPGEPAGLQGTEMWLSILYTAAHAIGLSNQLSFSPRGVHKLRNNVT